MSESKGFMVTNWFKLFFVALTIFLIGIYFHRENLLDACLENADASYHANWVSQCKIAKKDSDCLLTKLVADDIAKAREVSANECFKRYSLR